MAYDLILESRIKDAVKGWRALTTKKMFGGIGWLLHGHLCFGIWNNELIVRCDVLEAATLLKRPHVRPFDLTRRPMKGWLLIEPAGYATATKLKSWLALARIRARALPKK